MRKFFVLALLPLVAMVALAGCGDAKLKIDDLTFKEFMSTKPDELHIRVTSKYVVMNGGFKIAFKKENGDTIRQEERIFSEPFFLYAGPIGLNYYFDYSDPQISSWQIIDVYGKRGKLYGA